MKAATLTILLTSVICLAIGQEIEIDKIDDFTGVRSISTKSMTGKYFKKTDFVDKANQVSFSTIYSKVKTGNEYWYLYFMFSFLVDSPFGCLSEYDGKIILLLANDSTLTLDQVSKTSCNNYVNGAYYSIRASANETDLIMHQGRINELFEELSNVEIKKMRVYGTEGSHDFEFKDEKRNIVSLHIKFIKSKL